MTGGGVFGAAPPPGRIIDRVRLDQAQLPAADNLLQAGGTPEEVALRFVAAFPIENGKLALGFDPSARTGISRLLLSAITARMIALADEFVSISHMKE